MCELDFATSTPETVEITFRPHPSIRKRARRVYCAAEPATREHILAQQELAPGEHRTVSLQPGLGRLRLRVKGEERVQLVDLLPEGAGDVIPWSARLGALGESSGPTLALRLENDTTTPRLFVVERSRWSDDALRPATLFTLSDFHDLFSDQLLNVDVQLSVGEQTILFTDMVGSTHFYESKGDSWAFAEIKKHFSDIGVEVARNRGAVIKTIGDAVMAAFPDPVDALRAARAIQQHYPRGATAECIRLRISLNLGPCIAVRLNSGLDLFGRTVNLAAKLQACAEGGQIAMSGTVRDAPGVAEHLAAVGANLERVSLDPYPVDAYRWDTNRK